VVDAFTISAPGGGSSGLVTDPTLVFTEPMTPRPAYLTPTTDPTFNTQVVRIANDTGLPTTPVSGTWGADARHVYSKQGPWNSDQTLITIENRGGPSPLFLDGTTYKPLFGPCANDPLWDYRWHPSRSHAHELINVDQTGTELMWFDVTTCTKTRTWPLPITSQYGIGSAEGNPSNDGRYVAIASNTQMLIVDMDPQAPLAPYPSRRIGPARDITDCGLTDCSIDWVGVSASGKYAIVSYNGDYPRVFDINPSTLALTPHVYPAATTECLSHDPANGFILDLGHADVALNPFDNNEDVIIGQRSNGCPATTWRAWSWSACATGRSRCSPIPRTRRSRTISRRATRSGPAGCTRATTRVPASASATRWWRSRWTGATRSSASPTATARSTGATAARCTPSPHPTGCA
jgi:hypothetical protein